MMDFNAGNGRRKTMHAKKRGADTLLRGAILTLLVAAGACYEHTYQTGSGGAGGAVVYDSWRHHWIGGLISPDQEMELEEVCPSGNATIHEEMSFLNGPVGALTSGIYTPTKVEVRCREGRNSDLDFSAADIERIVVEPEFVDWVAARAPELLEDALAALPTEAPVR